MVDPWSSVRAGGLRQHAPVDLFKGNFKEAKGSLWQFAYGAALTLPLIASTAAIQILLRARRVPFPLGFLYAVKGFRSVHLLRVQTCAMCPSSLRQGCEKGYGTVIRVPHLTRVSGSFFRISRLKLLCTGKALQPLKLSRALPTI